MQSAAGSPGELATAPQRSNQRHPNKAISKPVRRLGRKRGMKSFIPRLTFIVSIALSNGFGIAVSEPTLFAPDAISIKDQVTLSPGFAPDGKTAYYTQSACASIARCPQHLYISENSNGAWSKGERVDRLGDYRVDWPSVTPDGETLILTWTAPREVYAGLDIITNFDLFTLDLTIDAAMPVAIDGADINRPRAGKLKTRRAFHVQSAGILTKAGDLYFWDEREDAVGERDIFVARSAEDGGYEQAKPLPAPINSTGRDHHSWISPNGGLMLISYPDRGGLGEDDIYVSRNINGEWSDPTSLGPGLNSAYSDFAARLTPDGSAIVFTSDRPGPDRRAGVYQIWQMDTASLIEEGTLLSDDLNR